MAKRHKIYTNVADLISKKRILFNGCSEKEITKQYIGAIMFNKAYRNTKENELWLCGEISEKMKSLDIVPIIAKGIPLSYHIYNTPYQHQCSDIDIIVPKKDQVLLCKYLQSLGGKDKYAEALNCAISDNKAVVTYFDCCWEKEFFYKKDQKCFFIEIKDIITRLPPSMCKDYIYHLQKIEINNVFVYTFDTEYTFLNLVKTTYDNFTYWGSIGNENTIRDLWDIYNYTMKIYKYINIFQLSENYNLVEELYTVLLLTKKLFNTFNLGNI